MIHTLKMPVFEARRKETVMYKSVLESIKILFSVFS